MKNRFQTIMGVFTLVYFTILILDIRNRKSSILQYMGPLNLGVNFNFINNNKKIFKKKYLKKKI